MDTAFGVVKSLRKGKIQEVVLCLIKLYTVKWCVEVQD